MVSDYERQRLLNMERNKALLMKMGLDKPLFEPKAAKQPKAPSKKRKLATPPAVEHDNPHAPKSARTETATSAGETGAVRRSSRNAGRTVDYNAEHQKGPPIPVSFKSGIRDTENSGPLGREAGSKRLHDPKVFGSIPGIEVGTWWETREGCSADSIHAPWVGGISGGPHGAYSVALSGGYPDDVDWGYAFTYTGSGGRNLKGTKANPLNLRAAPQSSDQTFENSFNKALKISSEKKKPVRVIRGFKVDSPYAPYEGYRYDGLYRVEKAWQEKGMEGFLVCKFAFKRLPNQPPLPRRADADDASNDDTSTEAKMAEGEEEVTVAVEGSEGSVAA
ncbi:PUA-like domain-containing protein [Mycena maculata]|uniref:PUA-like domain-containing protein n=1 Tax=Mycena maculata TaxID=230809 RepID=A0AAD7KE90_9AGAR|nr:PUA-like domain-containing protein [Mycena maculata]